MACKKTKLADILVVDDDVIYITLMANILTSENHNVFFAKDGAEALKLCESQKFDLIITDILMPNIDGIDLIMKLKKCKSNTPIVAISAGSRNNGLSAVLNLQTATALGVHSTLQKPFCPERLMDVVDIALNN
jgi:two-component system chemotaxis response regulator CheY